jgi:hypothetical protein
MKTRIGLPPAFYTGTADKLVYVGRCLLVYARVVGAAIAGNLIIYDGKSTDGVKKLCLNCAIDCADESQPTAGMIFEQGLYVDIGGGGTDWFIGIAPIEEEGGEG